MTILIDIERRGVVARGRRPVRRRPPFAIAALLSVGLHVVLIGGVLLWMHRSHSIVLVPAENPATVELVMSPPGGEPAPAAAAPSEKPPEKSPAPETPQATAAIAPAPPVAPAPAEEPAPAVATPPPPAPAAPTVDEPPPPASSTETAAAPRPAPPAPKPAEGKLTFDFAQAESDTNAWVTGSLVVPPSPDIKFHNRKPSYPIAAAQRGEQGTVVVLIHVTAEGLVTDVEVVHSSGFPTLDRAASDTVQTWHFLPSIKNGEPVPSDVPFQFVFSLD
jgi:protein TonB